MYRHFLNTKCLKNGEKQKSHFLLFGLKKARMDFFNYLLTVEILYLLIPLVLVLAGAVVWAFFWSVRSGQFDDLEGPAHRILMDNEEPRGRA